MFDPTLTSLGRCAFPIGKYKLSEACHAYVFRIQQSKTLSLDCLTLSIGIVCLGCGLVISRSLLVQIIWRDNAVLTATKALYFIRKYFISYARFYIKSKRQCSIVVVIVFYYYYDDYY